jgi:hypothetical protein
MFRHFNASDWALVILALTVPLVLSGLLVGRILGVAPLNEDTASALSNVLSVIVGAVASRLSMKSPNGEKATASATSSEP